MKRVLFPNEDESMRTSRDVVVIVVEQLDADDEDEAEVDVVPSDSLLLLLLLSSLFSSISLRNQTSPTADVSRDPSRFHGNLAHESCLGLLSRLSAVMVS